MDSGCGDDGSGPGSQFRGVRDPGFVCRISNAGIQLLGVRFRVSGFRFQVSGSRFRVRVSELRLSEIGA